MHYTDGLSRRPAVAAQLSRCWLCLWLTLGVSVLQPADLAAALAGCSQLTQLYPTESGASTKLLSLRRDWNSCTVSIRQLTDTILAALPEDVTELSIIGEQRQHVQAVDITTYCAGNDGHPVTVCIVTDTVTGHWKDVMYDIMLTFDIT